VITVDVDTVGTELEPAVVVAFVPVVEAGAVALTVPLAVDVAFEVVCDEALIVEVVFTAWLVDSVAVAVATVVALEVVAVAVSVAVAVVVLVVVAPG